MSYAIANIIYGIPLHKKNDEGEWSEALHEIIESENDGVIRLYSGNADFEPTAFGLQLSRFDECAHHIDLSELNFHATYEQTSEFVKLWKTLEQNVQEEIACNFGGPRVFILWSTS